MYILWLCGAVFLHLPSFESLGIDLKADVSVFLAVFLLSLLVSTDRLVTMQLQSLCFTFARCSTCYSSCFWQDALRELSQSCSLSLNHAVACAAVARSSTWLAFFGSNVQAGCSTSSHAGCQASANGVCHSTEQPVFGGGLQVSLLQLSLALPFFDEFLFLNSEQAGVLS